MTAPTSAPRIAPIPPNISIARITTDSVKPKLVGVTARQERSVQAPARPARRALRTKAPIL